MTKTQILRTTQLSISALCLCLSICVLATAGHSLQVYRSQYLTNPWWLPLWNAHFDVTGTNTLIGAGATALVLNLVFIGCCVLPKLRLTERPTLRALLTFAIASLSCIVTFAAVIFVHVANARSPHVESIQTWTCKFKGDTSGSSSSDVPKDVSNDAFGELCNESKFSLYTTLTIFLLQGSMMAIAVLSWCADQWAARKQRKFRDLDNDGGAEAASVEMQGHHGLGQGQGREEGVGIGKGGERVGGGYVGGGY